ncbi:S-layer homology domain-containing protein [Paenibacillus sp. SN-8-1]|uniref:S-layer homology domain-containing protein n=1 Tax=Paenibacillus sp. SN-8-1 TaxID=3435409 RepID=UPI003D9A9427
MKKQNLKHKSISVLSTAVLLGALAPHASAATTLTDIPNNYAKQAILELVEKGIMNGTGNGKFNPTSNISRQDFAIVLARSLNLDLSNPPATATFKDVPKDHYAYAAVEAAVKAGLVKGTGGGQFGTGQNLTREQMAVIFVNALGVDSTGKGRDLTFSDASSIASWAKDSVATAVEFGLMNGNPDGTFNPSNSASRQDLALVASKFLTEKVKVDEQHKAEQESNKPTPPVETKPPVVTPTPTPPVIVTPVPTPEQPDTTPLLQGVQITNLTNETYYKQDVTPYSTHSDVKKVELWKAAYGLFGRSQEELKVENYTLGTKLSEEASYHLKVTDNQDHVVETWFSIDKTAPSIFGDIYQSQNIDGNTNAYDQGDNIVIAFNRSIQKFDSTDINNAAASETLPEIFPGLSVQAIEEAVREKSLDYTLGDGAYLITQNPMGTINHVPYGNIFKLVLGAGANIPAAGLTITLDPNKIVGPSGLKPAGPFTITIPAIPVAPISENNAPSVSNVKITGVNEVGKTLTGSYDFSDQDLGDLEGETTYKWYRVDNDGVSNQEEIVGATAKTYTLTAEDSGHKIIFEVTPVDSRGKAGSPLQGLTGTDVTDPAPTISDLNDIGLSANTPDTQLYLNQSITPTSTDSDIENVKLSRTTDTGLDYYNHTYGTEVTGYKLGDIITEDGSYELAVTDKAGQTTKSYFTIDTLVPALSIEEPVTQEQTGGTSSSIYDSGDSISINFNDPIKKYTVMEDSEIENLDTDNVFTMDQLESALNSVDPSYTFGEGATLMATSTNGLYIGDGSYDKEFQIILGDNANIPAAGVPLTLPASIITGPTGVPAAGSISIVIPAIPVAPVSENNAPSVSNVKITGVNEAGKTLTGSYDFSDEDFGDLEGETTYKWYRVDNDGTSNQEEIVGATDKTYTLTAADSGHKIIFEVTPVDSRGKAGSSSEGLTDTDVTDPAPTISDLNDIGLSANTPDTQLYLNQSVTPTSPDSDIMNVKLSKTDTGLNYYNDTYGVEVTDYNLGDSINEDGSYELSVTDKGGQTTKSYFTIDTIVPALSTEEPVTQQQSGDNNSSYDYNDSIWITFNDPIKKFTLLDDSGIEGLNTDNVLTIDQLETALKSVDPTYTFGQDAMLMITSSESIYIGDSSYASGFQIILGDNPHVPAAGVTLTLPASIISGPTGIHPAGDISITIPAIPGGSNEGPAIPGGDI